MAFFKGSFYYDTPLFQPDEQGQLTFSGLRARPMASPEPILEHNVELKQRLDSIAHHYYADSRAWRWIAETNPDVLFPEDLLFEAEPDQPGYDVERQDGRERLGHVILIPRRRGAGQ